MTLSSPLKIKKSRQYPIFNDLSAPIFYDDSRNNQKSMLTQPKHKQNTIYTQHTSTVIRIKYSTEAVESGIIVELNTLTAYLSVSVLDDNELHLSGVLCLGNIYVKLSLPCPLELETYKHVRTVFYGSRFLERRHVYLFGIILPVKRRYRYNGDIKIPGKLL